MMEGRRWRKVAVRLTLLYTCCSLTEKRINFMYPLDIFFVGYKLVMSCRARSRDKNHGNIVSVVQICL